MDVIRPLASVVLMLTAAGCATADRPTPSSARAPAGPTASAAAVDEAMPTPEAPPEATLPGIHLHLDEGYVELDARISPRAGEWLELVACAGQSLEHESLVTVEALPSHVHMALLLLGAEPGKPQTWRQEDGAFILEPAAGEALTVSFVLPDDPAEIPAGEWVVNQHTGEPMGPVTFLFTGSRFVEIRGDRVYAADINGPVVTLVHFGDEVAGPAGTDLTNRTDEQQWNARADRIPPVGTPLRVRIALSPKP